MLSSGLSKRQLLSNRVVLFHFFFPFTLPPSSAVFTCLFQQSVPVLFVSLSLSLVSALNYRLVAEKSFVLVD